MSNKTIVEYIKEAVALKEAIKLKQDQVREVVESACEATNTDKAVFNDMVAKAFIKAQDNGKYVAKREQSEEVFAVVDELDI